MEKTYGMIAGSGPFPFFLLEEMMEKGYGCVIAGIMGETDSALKKKADGFELFSPFQIKDLISFFHSHNIHEVFFAGKIEHKQIYQEEMLHSDMVSLMDGIKDMSPSAIIERVIDLMAENGIDIQDPSPLLANLFCKESVMSKAKPSDKIMQEIEFAWSKVKHLADLDIGQTMVVKDQAVVAVEGMEGTDEAIHRGGLLAGKGTVVVKVSRSRQDNRIDMPAVGKKTIQSLVDINGAALCFEAETIPFFQKKEALELADQHEIVILARK